jgi:predicted nucleic acid-binding protein
MTLTDTGPLVALINRREPKHRTCVEVLRDLEGPLLSTWPVVTEAMYLLGRAGGWAAQEVLWKQILRGDIAIAAIEDSAKRFHALMEKYRDVPIDLADASLVALAEERHLTRIFTLDSRFAVYRIANRRSFEIVPPAS